MKLIITRDNLKDLVARAKGIVAAKPTSPVLGCVILDATDDGIDATAMQVGMGYAGQYKANVSYRGKVAVPVADLNMAVSSLPLGPISMDLADNGRITLSVGKSKATIGTLDPADHPGVASVNPNARMTVAAPDLARVLDQVKASMGEDGHKFGLDGVSIDSGAGAGILRLATTDGNRLAWSECACTGDIPRKVFIPRKCALELRSMIDGFAGNVMLCFEDNRSAYAGIDGARLTMSLSQTEFPEYRQVLPKDYKRDVRFDRAEMQDIVKRLSVFDASTLEIAITRDTLAFKAKKADGGPNVGTAEMGGELEGESITVGMSPRILADALASCSGDVARLRIGDLLTPISLDDPGNGAAQFIIMPMRLG